MILIHFGILIVSIAKLQGQKTCDPSYCNYEGTCEFLNVLQKKCACMPNVSKGDKCNEFIDVCLDTGKNMCQMESKCKSLPGSFNCECKPGYYAYDCKQETKGVSPLKDPILSWNRIVQKNKKEHFLLTTAENGDLSYDIIFTPPDTCGKHSLKTDAMKLSNNLRMTCKSYGIHYCSHLTETKGFYAAFENTFDNIGEYTCGIKILHSAISLQVLSLMMDFQIKVQEIDHTCNPTVLFSGGSSIDNPLYFRADHRVVITPLIETGCPDKKSSFNFKYQIRTLQNVLSYVFPAQKTKDLIIEPYQLNRYVNDVKFLVVLKVTEIVDSTGHEGSVNVNIFVQSTAPLKAIIEGGLLRQIKYGNSIVLNGRKSRDLKELENAHHDIRFDWSCTSEANFCNEFSYQGPQLVIPNVPDSSYMFKLIISKGKRRASAVQTIQIIDYEPLDIQIKCIKNCLDEKSNIENFIHLQALCLSCINSNEDVQYQWTYNDKIIGNSERLIYELKQHPSEVKFVFNLQGSLDNQLGKYMFETKVSTIKDGNCKISPNEGIPLITMFEIVCDDVRTDQYDVITSYIYQNDVFLLHTQQKAVKMFLIDLNITETKLKIVMKNLYGVKKEGILSVKLNKLEIEPSITHLQQFIDNMENPRNIRSSVHIGDHVQAIGIFNTLTTKLSQLDNANEKVSLLEKLLFSVKSLPDAKYFNPTLLSSALYHLSNKTDTPHQLSSKISELLVQTASLIHELSDDVIRENAHMLIQTINHIIQPFDDVNDAHDDYVDQPDEPFTEHYPDYGELEVDIIRKYQNLEKLVSNVEKTIEILTETFVTGMNPLEPAISIETMNSTHYFRIMNLLTETILKEEISHRLNSNIELDQMLLNELTKNTWNKVMIGISLFNSNPYWWYPDKNTNVSNIYMINIVEQSMSYPNERKFVHKLKHSIKIVNSISTDRYSQVSGIVEHMYDMPSFKFLAAMNETLDINFQITPIDAVLKGGFISNKRPKYKEVVSQSYDISNGTELWYKTHNSDPFMKSSFIHMGLISTNNISVSFNFTTTSLSCVEWNKRTSHWTTTQSEIVSKLNKTSIECNFRHLSTVAMTQQKPLLKKEALRTFPHVLVENQVVLYLIAVMLFIFVVSMVWAYYQDKKDIEYRTAIIVGDNSPIHEYQYLVIIQTGSDAEAGTSSHVGIQLQGEMQNSQKHLLGTPDQGLFLRFRESSFIICTPGALGKIHQVLIWHDNTGTNPSWHCQSIIVRDLTMKQEFTFLVEQWISLLQTDQTFAYVKLATEKEFCSRDAIIRANQFFTMQNQLWPYNLLYKHPRSITTRKEIILCGFQQLLVSMLVNIILYGKSTVENLEDEIEEFDHFGHYETIILYALISLTITFIINYPMRYLMEHSSLVTADTHEDKYDKIFLDNREYQTMPEREEKFLSSKLKILWYIVSCIICLTSITLIITYGYHFGNVKFLMWTISVCIQVAKSYFITSPILTYISLHYFPKNTKQRFKYHIPIIIRQIKEKAQTKLEMLRIHSSLKVKRFNDKCYAISFGVTENAKKLTHQKYELRELISDLLMFLTFFVSLNVLILGTRDSNTYYSTKMVKNMFVNGKFSPMGIDDVSFDGDFWQYLNKTLVPVMHLGTQHNKVKIEKELGWLPGKFAKVLGVAQIRQIRIKDSACQRSRLTPKTTCQSKYTNHHRDTENYFPNWTNYHEFSYENAYWRLIHPWKYVTKSFFEAPPLYAVEHWYSGGGYIAQLGRTFNNTMKIINFLRKYNWIDAHTRVVFIEFTIYNADADIFNVVNLMFERNAVGQWHTGYQIQSCKFLFHFSNMGTWFVVVFVLFVILTGTFLIRLIYKVFKDTLKSYFKDIWNLTDTIIVVMSIQIVMLFIKRNDYVEDLLKELEITKNNEFISFGPAATLDKIISYVSGILVCVATIRLWKILLFAQVFRLFTNTLYHASYAIISCAIIIMVFLVGYSSCIYLINGTNSEVLHSLWTVLPTITAVSFGMEPFDLNNIMYGGKMLGIILFIVMLSIISLFLVNMFITVIIFYFDISKEEERNEGRLYTIWDFIRDRTKIIKNPFGKKLKRHDSDQIISEPNPPNPRLRGGQHTNIFCSSSKINDVADTIDAQLTYLEEYFKDFSERKKKQVLNHVKDLQGNIITTLNALRINIEAKITVYEAETDDTSESSQDDAL